MHCKSDLLSLTFKFDVIYILQDSCQGRKWIGVCTSNGIAISWLFRVVNSLKVLQIKMF